MIINMMMIVMMILWGLYIYNLIIHMYIWYSKCQNVTPLNSASCVCKLRSMNHCYLSEQDDVAHKDRLKLAKYRKSEKSIE